MKKKGVSVIVFINFIAYFSVCLAAESYMKADKKNYPYDPSLVKWENSGVDFVPPETCGECHPEKYDAWKGSMHSLAFTDPVYQGELNIAIKHAGKSIARQCEGCHSPAAMVKGELMQGGLKGLGEVAMAGVSCDVCHSVKGHTHWQTPYHQPENGSIILAPGREGKDGPERVKYGPNAPDEWCGDEFHKCMKSDLHMSSELCASCHQVSNYRTHTPLEETYREWKNGPYSVNNIHCQDCHMVDTDVFKRTADTFKRPGMDEYNHYFNGANFLLYYLTGLAAEKAGDTALAQNVKHKYDMAVQRLKAAAELSVSPVYRGDRMVEIKVRVKNIRAGHNLTTSLTNIRQMWLEVVARDNKGNVIMRTGCADENGKIPEEARMFNSHTQDKNLEYTIEPWEAETFSRNETIPPKGYKDVHYGLSLPRGEQITIEARLRYRQADQKVAEKLLGMVPEDIHLEAIYGIKEIPTLPIIDMVTTVVRLNGKDS